MTPDAYCREIEAYLTRKNDGHLIRIAGPSFDLVRGWAEQGVPLKVAFQGIDRYFERYYAKGPRRRPVFIDHCEGDVLESFDAWRRAVGVFAVDAGHADPAPRRRESLAAAIERAVARLTSLRAGEEQRLPADVVEEAVRALDAVLPAARGARGEARQAVVDRIGTVDATLIAAARTVLTPAESEELRQQAEADLAPYRDRMPADGWQRSVDAAIIRTIRQRFRLPVIAAEE